MQSMTKTNEGMGARESFVGGGNTCVICSCGRPVWWYIEMPPVCPWCLRELRSASRDTARTTSRSELEDLILAMEVEMRFQDVQKMAKGLGVNPYRKKKMELIQAIQGAEENIPCFGTDRVNDCGEQSCLWRTDCLKVNGNAVQL